MEFSNGFLLSLSLCLDIGLANIAMITLSMQRGFSKGLWLGLGTCVGDLAYAILAMLGMAVLLQYEAVRYVLWLGGTAVLAWFCFKMVMSATTVSTVSIIRMSSRTNPAFRCFCAGFFWQCRHPAPSSGSLPSAGRSSLGKALICSPPRPFSPGLLWRASSGQSRCARWLTKAGVLWVKRCCAGPTLPRR